MCAKFLQKQAKTVAVMIWKKFEDRHQTDRQTDRQTVVSSITDTTEASSGTKKTKRNSVCGSFHFLD